MKKKLFTGFSIAANTPRAHDTRKRKEADMAIAFPSRTAWQNLFPQIFAWRIVFLRFRNTQEEHTGAIHNIPVVANLKVNSRALRNPCSVKLFSATSLFRSNPRDL